MKVLLRHAKTGWYYQEPSKWTPLQEEAFDLEGLPRAVKLALDARFDNVEVLLSFDDPRFNLVLPVTRPSPPPDAPPSPSPSKRPVGDRHKDQL